MDQEFPSGSELKEYKKALATTFGRDGIPPSEVLMEIRKAVFPYDVSILKSEKSLQRALIKIEAIRNEVIPLMGARDPHYLMKALEVEEIALVSELYLRASLMREESRAGHFRADFPDRNNDKWLCWILARQDGEKIRFTTKHVPVYKYRIKLSKYYSDNLTFPNVMKLLS
ncbi:MAG: hypothetical protein JRJ82_08125 [Deltaproteobacteria bacterium]|nr:hypothetical protein [Deltaproteobacteria bacterium]